MAEALNSEFRDQWIAASKAEYESLVTREVWEEVTLPKDRKALKSKWVFAYKENPDGTLKKFKARLVAAGYSQVEGIDYRETFSAVVKVQTVRILMALAVMYGLDIEQMDVATAFLYGILDEPNYMQMPEGFEKYDKDGKPMVCKLIKSIYGLHQSSRVWGETLAEFLLSEGFTQLHSDTCVFRKYDSKTRKHITVLVYVDDLLLLSSCKTTIKRIKDRFKIQYEMSDLGTAKYVLGISIERFGTGTYFGQPNYIREILESTNMWEIDRTGETINTKSSPMMTTWEHDDKAILLDDEAKSSFMSTLMKLAYLAQQSRPDILFAINKLSQFQSKANLSDQKALERILRYLRGTWDYGLMYNKPAGGVLVMTNDPNIFRLLQQTDTPSILLK
jgi:hypothetical protein